jgi:hypothetical protein
MPGGNYIVFGNMRPPVCIDESEGSPLRTKKAQQIFKIAESGFKDQMGFKITKH